MFHVVNSYPTRGNNRDSNNKTGSASERTPLLSSNVAAAAFVFISVSVSVGVSIRNSIDSRSRICAGVNMRIRSRD